MLLLRSLHADSVLHGKMAIRGSVVHPLSGLPGHLDLHLDHDHDHHRPRQIRRRLLPLQAENAGGQVFFLPGKPYRSGELSTVDLLVRTVANVVKLFTVASWDFS